MTDSEIKEIQLVSLESACIKEKHSNEENDVREFVFKLSGSVDETWKCCFEQYCKSVISDIENGWHEANHSWLFGKKELVEEWKADKFKKINNFLEIAKFNENKLIIESTEKSISSNIYILMNIIHSADAHFRSMLNEEQSREQTIIDKINTSIEAWKK